MGLFAATMVMNRQLTQFFLLATAVAFTIKAKASDRWETLRAINWVENPTNQTHVGRFGELGPYQFRPATWRMHTDKPFRLAVERATADEVAIKHYEWIKQMFEKAGVEPSAFNIAMAWNCGVDTVVAGRVPNVSYNYAQRVNNLVETFKENARPVATEEKQRVEPGHPGFYLDDRGETLRFRVLQEGPRFVLAAG